MVRPCYIGKSFQSKMVLKACLLTFAGSAVFSSTAYLILKKDINGGFPGALEAIRSLRMGLSSAVGLSEVAAMILAVFGVAAIGILMSHRLAGPLWKVEKAARSVAEGDLSFKVTLRENDEVQDLARQVNCMVQGIKDKVCKVEEAYMQVEQCARQLKEKYPDGMTENERAVTLRELNLAASELASRLDAIKTDD